MRYATKTAIGDPNTDRFDFREEKTMYGGKHIGVGDTLFVFASETQGGHGLLGRGTVVAAESLPRKQAESRETPRVSVSVADVVHAKGPFGRSEAKAFANWKDGQPETGLNFKLYRQATNKIVGLTDTTAAFLEGFF